jgi:hypothetical protein
MKTPELTGIRARILSLQAVDWISGVVLGPLSLPRQIAFPHGRAGVGGDLVRMLSQCDGRPIPRMSNTDLVEIRTTPSATLPIIRR